ncbi:MAG: DNA repair protein RecO [Pseudomonadota bacterium]
MDWRSEGILLNVRRHGESSAIIDVFTPDHGRHAGIVRGGTSRRLAPILQPGAQIDVHWRARLEEHLGTYAVEPVRSRAAQVMSDRIALAGLNAVVALVAFALPEREEHASLYRQTEQLLDLLGQGEVWPLAYLRFELALLENCGLRLDLSECAVTGAKDGLIYVSPRTGRAVSAEGAGEWADKLLPLPPILRAQGEGDDSEVLDALRVTGYFLDHKLAQEQISKPLPEARGRYIDQFARQVTRP